MVEPEPVGGGQAGSAAQQIWSLPGSLPSHLPGHGDGWRHEGGLELQPLQQAALHQPDTHHQAALHQPDTHQQGQFRLSSCTELEESDSFFLKLLATQNLKMSIKMNLGINSFIFSNKL